MRGHHVLMMVPSPPGCGASGGDLLGAQTASLPSCTRVPRPRLLLGLPALMGWERPAARSGEPLPSGPTAAPAPRPAVWRGIWAALGSRISRRHCRWFLASGPDCLPSPWLRDEDAVPLRQIGPFLLEPGPDCVPRWTPAFLRLLSDG